MVTKRVDIADLEEHLAEDLEAVKRGVTLVVVDRGVPVARIEPATVVCGGIVTRPPTRDLASVRRALKRLAPGPLPGDGLSVLLEDRQR